MPQNPSNLKSLTLRYLGLFAGAGLAVAAYLVATVSVLAASLVFVASLEAGIIFAGLAVRQSRGVVLNEVLLTKTVDVGLRRPREVSESKA